MVFWHRTVGRSGQQIEQYLRRVYQDNGYLEVRCPQVLDRSLWEKSATGRTTGKNMFTNRVEKRDLRDQADELPGHVLIYNRGLHSYRELPLRYGEFGVCTRNEPSGALHGIMRIRAFTQDDGHIFCTEEQIQPEVTAFTALLQKSLRRLWLHRGRLQARHAPCERVGPTGFGTRPNARSGRPWTRAVSATTCSPGGDSTAPRSNTI